MWSVRSQWVVTVYRKDLTLFTRNASAKNRVPSLPIILAGRYSSVSDLVERMG